MTPFATLFKRPEMVTDPDLPMIILSWLVFGIAFYVIAKLVWKPISDALARREYQVRDDLLKAHQAQLAVEKAGTQKSDIIREAHTEAQRIAQQGAEAGRKLQADITKQAHDDAAALLQSAQDQLARERTQLLTQVRDQGADLATQLATQLLSQQFTADDANTFTQHMIEKIKNEK